MTEADLDLSRPSGYSEFMRSISVGELRQNPTRMLDAVEGASALRSGAEDIVVCTHDSNMKSVAALMGMAVHDPIS